MKTLERSRDLAEILERLGRIRPDGTGRWGRMTAHGMVCHLADSLRMMMGERPVSPATSALRRTLVKWIVLYFPAPWPTGILTGPELDQESGGTRPADFASDAAELAALVERAAGHRPLAGHAHPVFGRLSRAQWLRWAYLHADHHLRQFGA